MSIFDALSGIFGNKDSKSQSETHGVTSQKRKIDGSIDHRGHTENDRTPAQKEGDKARTKNK